jgi:hypothetical protein
MDQPTIIVKHVRELPKGFKIVSGRALLPMSTSAMKSTLHRWGGDPRFLGGLPQPDGALLVFQDGTSVLSSDDVEIS